MDCPVSRSCLHPTTSCMGLLISVDVIRSVVKVQNAKKNLFICFILTVTITALINCIDLFAEGHYAIFDQLIDII